MHLIYVYYDIVVILIIRYIYPACCLRKKKIIIIFVLVFQGFDEYMNLVLDEAEEIHIKSKTRKPIGNYMLSAENQQRTQGSAEFKNLY